MSLLKDHLPGVPEVSKDGQVVVALPLILDGTEFIEKKLIRPPVLIEGLLHMGSKCVVGGASKAKKTWTLLDMGLSIATGQDWWGRTTSQGEVLYVNLEIQPWAFQARLQAVLAHRGLTLGPKQFHVWNLRGFAADASILVPRMTQETKARGLALIIIDPIYKCLGGRDENKAGDIGTLMNELDKLAVETGAAVAFGAHFSKGNQAARESIDRIGGSGVFARDPDTILTMTAHEEPEAFTVEVTLRNFAPVEPFCVCWEYPVMKLAPDLLPGDLKQPASKARKPVPTADELLNSLPKTWPAGNPRAGLCSAGELTKWCQEHGFDKNALVALRDELEQRGDIRVIRDLPHHQVLAGTPRAADAFDQWRAKKRETARTKGRKPSS